MLTSTAATVRLKAFHDPIVLRRDDEGGLSRLGFGRWSAGAATLVGKMLPRVTAIDWPPDLPERERRPVAKALLGA